jgi:hypothetical protein
MLARMRRWIALATLAAVCALPAAAQAMSPLSKSTASGVAERYASREGSRIFRLRALTGTSEASRCKRRGRYDVACPMVLDLYYGGWSSTPTELEACLDVRKVSSTRVRFRATPWEVLPPKEEEPDQVGAEIAHELAETTCER